MERCSVENRVQRTAGRLNHNTEAYSTLLHHKDLGALPIVDGSGHIIGNVSVRDLRGVITSQRLFEALHLPVTEFVAANVPDAGESSVVWRSGKEKQRAGEVGKLTAL